MLYKHVMLLRRSNMSMRPCIEQHLPLYCKSSLQCNHMRETKDAESASSSCSQSAPAPGNREFDLSPFAGQQGEALFTYNESAACYWYNTTLRSSADAQRQYCVAGWLAGQALHNRTDLGIRLAPLLWQKVLQGGSFQVIDMFTTVWLPC